MDLGYLTPDQLEEVGIEVFGSNKPYNMGPLVIGSLIDALLCGILLMQCGTYISSNARDGWLLKAAVACMMIMNLCGTSLAWAWVWDLFVRNFGTYRTFFAAKYLSWAFVANIGSELTVQIFFALRAWKMVNRNPLFAVVSFVPMLAFIATSITSKIMFVRVPFLSYACEMKIPGYICLCSVVICDVLITTTILWYLLRWRGGNRRANNFLKKVVRITLESQLPPTLIAIVMLVMFAAQCENPVIIPLIWVHPKFYGISLFHTLNMRPEMVQPTVVLGTQTAPGRTAGNAGFQFSLGLAQTAQTAQTESDIAPHNHAVGVSQTRSYFATQHEPPKPTVVSFNEGVLMTPGGTLKVVDSHGGSSNTDLEMVETESKLPDLEADPPKVD